VLNNIATGGFAAQQRATEARDPKIKPAFEEVASGWFALAAQANWLDLERTQGRPDDNKDRRPTCRGLSAGRESMPMNVTTRADRYRHLARDCRLMAQSLPAGENRSALVEMAEVWERLADQQKQATDLNKK
jgi:hypothetical protein